MSAERPDMSFCVNHSQTPTGLRCNKCERPICAKCAVLTPVGYRCRECVRAQQQVFETAGWLDYVLAIVVTAPLASLGSLASVLGLFVIFLAPVIGGLTAEAVRLVVRRRRGRYLGWVATGAFVCGGLPMLCWSAWPAAVGLLGGIGYGSIMAMLPSLWALVYVVMGAVTVYSRLRGISIAIN